MKRRCSFVCTVLIGCSGCSRMVFYEPRGIPVTAERIAELKQICFTSEGFTANVPAEWQLLQHGGRSQAQAVFRPKDSQATIIYTHAVDKKPGQSLEDFIKADTEGLEQSHTMLVVSEGETVPIDSGNRWALTRFIEGDRFGNRSIAAFVDESERVVILGMSAHSDQEFAQEEQRFLKFVSSYHTRERVFVGRNLLAVNGTNEQHRE